MDKETLDELIRNIEECCQNLKVNFEKSINQYYNSISKGSTKNQSKVPPAKRKTSDNSKTSLPKKTPKKSKSESYDESEAEYNPQEFSKAINQKKVEKPDDKIEPFNRSVDSEIYDVYSSENDSLINSNSPSEQNDDNLQKMSLETLISEIKNSSYSKKDIFDEIEKKLTVISKMGTKEKLSYKPILNSIDQMKQVTEETNVKTRLDDMYIRAKKVETN